MESSEVRLINSFNFDSEALTSYGMRRMEYIGNVVSYCVDLLLEGVLVVVVFISEVNSHSLLLQFLQFEHYGITNSDYF